MVDRKPYDPIIRVPHPVDPKAIRVKMARSMKDRFWHAGICKAIEFAFRNPELAGFDRESDDYKLLARAYWDMAPTFSPFWDSVQKHRVVPAGAEQSASSAALGRINDLVNSVA